MTSTDSGSTPECESCGQPADLRLNDGSTWCISCDVAAREEGDTRTAVLLGSAEDVYEQARQVHHRAERLKTAIHRATHELIGGRQDVAIEIMQEALDVD